jgi:hypothetical protein
VDSKDVETRCNLKESSNEDYGSRRAFFASDDDDDK